MAAIPTFSNSPEAVKGIQESSLCIIPAGITTESGREKVLLDEYKFATDQLNTISIIDLKGEFTYVNDEHCRVSGYRKEEILGRHYNTLVHPDIPADITNQINETLYQKLSWKGVVKSRNKLGEPYWLKTKIIPVFDTDGNPVECISIGHDITQRHLKEEELRISFTRLLELDEKKDEFINIASHELRTPMTAIAGYISMILDGDAGEISPEAKMYLEQVFKSSRQLLTLINDMLDIAKLESGKGRLYYEDIEMRSFMEEVITNLKPLALLKRQNLEMKIDYNSLIYRTDNRKMQQVLINIVGNALKYTQEEGEVKIHSWVIDKKLFIEVTDNGIGIPEKHLSHIFEKFSQVKNTLTRDINGTGLGLAITKTIIEKFLGTIHVESEEGKGSIFTIELPLQSE